MGKYSWGILVKKKYKTNDYILYNALQSAKKYIVSQNDGSCDKDRGDVLKKIRSALAPVDHLYKVRARDIDKAINLSKKSLNKLNDAHYKYGIRTVMVNKRKVTLDAYYYELYRSVERITNLFNSLGF